MQRREAAFSLHVSLDRIEQLFSHMEVKRAFRHSVEVVSAENGLGEISCFSFLAFSSLSNPNLLFENGSLGKNPLKLK